MILTCGECGGQKVLLAKEEAAILAKLDAAGAGSVEIIDCRCGRGQIILRAKPRPTLLGPAIPRRTNIQ